MAENKDKSFDDKAKLLATNQQLAANEQQLQLANHDLGERVKELNCLYGLAEIVELDPAAQALVFLPQVCHLLGASFGWRIQRVRDGNTAF